jgi:hypothetical protein
MCVPSCFSLSRHEEHEGKEKGWGRRGIGLSKLGQREEEGKLGQAGVGLVCMGREGEMGQRGRERPREVRWVFFYIFFLLKKTVCK